MEDLVIRNNVFYECGELAEQAVIALNMQAKVLDFKSPVYKNVKIVDNLFIRNETNVPLLRARGTGGILFQRNRVELQSTDRALLSFTACEDVIVRDNFILNQKGPFKIEFAGSIIPELQANPEADWIIK